MRMNRRQEVIIGGSTRGTKAFDAPTFGNYDGEKLMDVAGAVAISAADGERAVPAPGTS